MKRKLVEGTGGEESQEGTGGAQTVCLVEKGVPGSESDRGLLITTTHLREAQLHGLCSAPSSSHTPELGTQCDRETLPREQSSDFPEHRERRALS